MSDAYQYPNEGWRCECGEFAHYERLSEVWLHGFLNCLVDAKVPSSLEGIVGDKISEDA